MKLAIATPFYLQAFPQYVDCILYCTKMLSKIGIDWEFITVINDSYVERAKNSIVSKFMESDCTDLLMIDSDLAWDPEGFLRLVMTNELIVGGVYPTKNNWENYACAIEVNDNQTPKMHGNLIVANSMPGGFIKYKREVFTKLQKAYPVDFYMDETVEKSKSGMFFNYFACMTYENKRYGEDIGFFIKWTALGEKIYIQPNISFYHYGTEGHKGNYHEFLLKQPKPESIILEEIDRINKYETITKEVTDVTKL